MVRIDETVKDLHKEISKQTTNPSECFTLVFDGDIMDPALLVSERGIQGPTSHGTPPKVTLIKTAWHGSIPTAKRCLLCLKTFPEWSREFLCRACYMEQVDAAREYWDRPADDDSETD